MFIGLGIAFVILFLCALGWIDYRSFINERKKTYERFSTVNTSYGEIEYLDMGPKDGPVILFSTGGGAGIDSALAFDWLTQSGYRIISVNRPGYYNLSVAIVDSIEGHAKIYHEVITALDIREVNILGVSMGGLSSLYYAQNFPVKSMVLWSAVTGEYHPNQESVDSPLGKLVMTNKGKDAISWIMVKSAKFFPKATIKSFLKTEADLEQNEAKELIDLIVKDKNEKLRFTKFVNSMSPMSKLYEGMMDEIKKSASPHSFNWNKIDMPVLACHSIIDKDVGYEHFIRLKRNLINGEFLSVRAGGHFVWWGIDGKNVIRETTEFLDKINK